MTKVSKCTCDHKDQDARYGKGNRVFNLAEGNKPATCTVCGKKKSV